MAPVQAPPKAAEKDASCKAIVDMLERQLADIQKTSNEKSLVELLTGRTIQLINALETLKHSAQQEDCFAIIDKVTDIFMTASEAGREATRCLIVAITESCIDVITCPAVILIHKIELLKGFNTLLENCPFSAKREILSREQFAEQLSLLCKHIVQVGDYEVQVCIIEFIFRLVPKSIRVEYMKKVLDGSEQWLEFLDIKDSTFEIDCRHFLNKLNKQNTGAMTRVYSYPAEVVSIDGVKLYKPDDSGYDDFWVDLNEGSKRIGIFCEPNFLSSQQSQNSEQLWETVSIWAQDVKRYSCSAKGMFWKALIELKVGADMISNKDPDNLTHVVTIVVAQQYNLKGALEDIFKIHHKASSVNNPVHIVQKQDLPAESSTLRSDCLRPCVGQILPQKQEDRNATRSKVSVPSEPMISPASSVITSSSGHPTLWHEIQERQKLQKEHLEKVLDRSGNAGRDNMGTVELCDKVQEDQRHFLLDSNKANITCYTSSKDKCLEYQKDANDGSSVQIKSTGTNNATADKENRGQMSSTVDEVKKGISENSTDKTCCSGRSQAKVKASEKCTDMTLHYMDARASDALVDVVSSQVTTSGDMFSSQVSPAKHSSATVSSKNGSDGVDNERIQQKCSEANAGEGRKESCDVVSSATTDNQLAKTPARSLRSRKRTCTTVGSTPITQSDIEITQSDSHPSQMDVIPATQRPDIMKLRGNRKIQKNQKKLDASTCEDEIVKSSYASILKDVKPCNKKRKSQQADTRGKNDSKSIHKAVTVNKKVSVISPGSTSLDDFKPSKSFRSLRSTNRQVTEKLNDTISKKAVDRMNTEANKDQNKPERRTQAKEKINSSGHVKRSGDGDENVNSDTITLKEFLPVLQNKEKTVNKINNKTTVLNTGVSSSKHDTSGKGNWIPTMPVEPSSKSMDTIRTCELEKSKALKSVDQGNKMEGEVASVSSSGELFIEISKEADKGCDVIEETQCELSPPFVFNTQAEDANKKHGAFVIPQQLSKTGKGNSKCPGESGDHISPAVGTDVSLNLESSYIFGKNTVLTANYDKTAAFEGKQSRLGNAKMKLKSPVGKKQFVGAVEACEKKADKSLSELNKTQPRSPRHENKTHEVGVEKKVKSTNDKRLSQASPCYTRQNSRTMYGKDRKQASKSFSVASPARMLRSRNKTISYTESISDDYNSSDEDVKNISRKSKQITDYHCSNNENAKSTSRKSKTIMDHHNSSDEDVTSISKKSKQVTDYHNSGDEDVTSVSKKSKQMMGYHNSGDEDVTSVSKKSKQVTDYHNSCDEDVTSISKKSKKMMDYHNSGDDVTSVSRKNKKMMDYHNSGDEDVTSISKKSKNMMDYHNSGDDVTSVSRKNKKMMDYHNSGDEDVTSISKKSKNMMDYHNSGDDVTSVSRKNKKMMDYHNSSEKDVTNTLIKSKTVTEYHNSSDEDVKSTSRKSENFTDEHRSNDKDMGSTSIKSTKMIVQNDLPGRSSSLKRNNVSKISPFQRLPKKQKDIYSICKLGSQASKTAQQNIEAKKHIWTKHRMEKTVTTMSYSKSVYSLSSDPYDFDAESKNRHDDTVSVVPLRSHLFTKDSSYGKSHSTPGKFHSTAGKFHCTPDKANYKKQDSKPFASQLACSKKAVKNKSMSDVNKRNSTHCVDRKRNSEPYAGKKQQHKLNCKKTPPTDTSVVRDSSHLQRNRYLSTGSSAIDTNSDSDRGSSQFGLYASQIEKEKSDTGLVFPHLDDSIPCTPLPEKNDSDDTTEKKSLASELSWLVQAKKTLEKQEQMKNKTYLGHKATETRHPTIHEEDPEPAPQYSRLHHWQASKTPDTLDLTSKLKAKVGTPGKRNIFSPLDFTTFSKSKDQGDDYKNSAVRKNQKDKTLTSAFKNTSLELTSLPQKNKKNLSFKSPNTKSSSFGLAGSASEDEDSLSEHYNAKSGLTIAQSGKSAQDAPSNARKQRDELFNLVSAHLEKQLQDVTDSVSENTVCNLYAENVSGPSSSIRPTRSQLKRKYPSMSTSMEDNVEKSDIEDVSEQETTSGHRHSFVSRKLFKSGVTPLKPHQDTSSVNKIGQTMKAAATTPNCHQFSQIIKHKKKDKGNWPHGHKVADREGTSKHFSFSERFDENVSMSQIGSKLDFDVCSPEKVRSIMHSSEEDFFNTGLESTPLIPLDLSSSNSPVIGFDEMSSVELDVDESGALQQTSLLDRVRKELTKSGVSQVSDEAELSVEAEVLDLNEAASTDICSLQEFLMKQNMKNMPLGSEDIDGAVKSTHQRIVSLWETDQRQSMNALDKFQSVAQKTFTCMNKNVKEMQESEMKINLLWSQEMEKIRKRNMAQKNQLTRLKKAHEVMVNELERVHTDGETSQKSLKTAMKQDLEALQRKLVAKCNDHALDAMRRCLHMSLLL